MENNYCKENFYLNSDLSSIISPKSNISNCFLSPRDAFIFKSNNQSCNQIKENTDLMDTYLFEKNKYLGYFKYIC